jgi:hypothetical protein
MRERARRWTAIEMRGGDFPLVDVRRSDETLYEKHIVRSARPDPTSAVTPQ